MTLSLTAMRYGCFFSIPYHRNRCDFVAQQLGLINDYLATVGSNIYLHEGTLSQFQAFDLKKDKKWLETPIFAGYCHLARRVWFHDRPAEGDCQARCLEHHGDAWRGRLRHRPHILRRDKASR